VLAINTLYKRPVFRDDEAARAVCRVHTAAWPWRDACLLAWVLMPDHWHGLVTLGERDTLSTLVGRFKALTSRAGEDRHRVNGWLWGRGFSDRVRGANEGPAGARGGGGAPGG
jgi:REP element-mobilizing transposase RayT